MRLRSVHARQSPPHRHQTPSALPRGARAHHRARPGLRPHASALHPRSGSRTEAEDVAPPRGRPYHPRARPHRPQPRAHRPAHPPGPQHRGSQTPGRPSRRVRRARQTAHAKRRAGLAPVVSVIATTSSGRRFAALARYLVYGRSGEETERVAWTAGRNLGTDDPEVAAAMMQATANANEQVEGPVYHLTINFDPADPVTPERMQAVPDRVRAHLAELRVARSWEELEATLARHGLRLERKGQGLVITDGKYQVKASRVARDLSLKRLEQRFGVPFPERERPAPAREPLSPAVEQITKAVDEHERLAALTAERGRADQDLAAARERLQRLNGALKRVRRASERFDAALARVYRD